MDIDSHTSVTVQSDFPCLFCEWDVGVNVHWKFYFCLIQTEGHNNCSFKYLRQVKCFWNWTGKYLFNLIWTGKTLFNSRSNLWCKPLRGYSAYPLNFFPECRVRRRDNVQLRVYPLPLSLLVLEIGLFWFDYRFRFDFKPQIILLHSWYNSYSIKLYWVIGTHQWWELGQNWWFHSIQKGFCIQFAWLYLPVGPVELEI